MNKNLCMNCMSDMGEESICPICGHDNKTPNDPNFLPVGYILANRFTIGHAYDANGEGVTYSAFDNSNNCAVVIREFFPADIASRSADGSIVCKAGCTESLNAGLAEFNEISRKLYTLNDQPCLFKVLGRVEVGGTSYRIMESVSGISLMEFLLRNGGTLTWEQARPLFLPLISTLTALHGANIIHRGISPETVFVGRDGKLRLKNFCIKPVRSRDSDITAQLYPGFAAVEQYGFEENAQEGAWTDVYGLCATLFRVLAGNPPCDATERLNNDSMTIPAKVAQTVPKHVLASLANGLQILPEDRTQSMTELRKDLTSGSDAIHTPADKKAESKANKKVMMIAAGCTAGFFVIIAAILIIFVIKPFDKKDDNTNQYSSAPSSFSDDEDVEPYSSTEKEFPMPDLKGLTLSEVIPKLEESNTKYEITGKVFSETEKRGTVCAQDVEAGKMIPRNTTVKLTMSLGPQQVKVPSLKGKTELEAKVALLELGISSENIEIIEQYVPSATPGVVIETNPAAGSMLNVDLGIEVRINSYDGSANNQEDADTEIEFE